MATRPPLPLVQPGFLDLPEDLSAWETSRFVVLQLPYDATCSYGVGCRFGPARILEASAQVEWFDEELGEVPAEKGICTLRGVEPLISSPDAYFDVITAISGEILDAGRTLVALGGEHSVTWGPYRALRARAPDLTVLQIDAHLDLRASYQGSAASHACIMRRILDDGAKTVQVGVRSGTDEEWALVRERGLPCFRARDLDAEPEDRWIQRVLASIPTRDVYLTLDLDGLDPSVIPATGTPEPGGLGYWRLLRLLRRVVARHRVLAFDVVELEPIPGNRVSEFAAAKIVYKIMGYVLQSPET